MAVFTWKSAASGNWGAASQWADDAVPNDALAEVALSPAGNYVVTVDAGSAFAARNITGATGVTLDVAGSLSIAGTAALSATVIEPAGQLSGQGGVQVGGTLVNNGLLAATVANSFLQVTQGSLTNTGTLAAPATGTYLFLNNTDLTNLSGGVLTGGTYAATGQPLGGPVATIAIARSGISTEITTLNATVILRHVNSTLQARDANGAVRSLDSTLATIGAAGALRLLDGRNYNTAQALSVAGVLELGGGALAASGGLAVAQDGVLLGSGVVASPLALAGTLHATTGTLSLSGGLSGAGTVAIDAGATLQLPAGSYDASFGGAGVLRATGGNLVLTAPLSGNLMLQVATGATIDLGAAGGSTLVFGGAGAKLAFTGAAGFSGVIAGMQTGNVLELKDVLATGASLAANGADTTLTLTTASGSVALSLAGDYLGKDVAVAPDGTGGTNVTVAGVSFVPGSAIWAAPEVSWSFAASNYAGAFTTYSSFVDPVAQADLAALWRAAFARWSQVSGLTFTELPDTPTADGQADIRVGWGNFGNPPAGEIGNAQFGFQTNTKKMLPGATVRLQDPSITPLVDSGGTLLYQNTVSSAFQVMLHEIGHALGLDHAAALVDPHAVMAPTATASNRDLDVSDIAGIRALYAGIAAPVSAAISIAALSASQSEGDAGSTFFLFTVSRTGDTASAASVSYAVAGSGANPAAGGDFAGAALPTGTVDFAAGEASRSLVVAVAGDATIEPDEGFTVTLSNPAGAALGTASAAGTIQNDDTASLAIAATDAARPEGGAGATTGFTFTVSRSGATGGALSVPYSVSGGALRPALAGDFVGGALPSGSVDFADGQTSRVVTIDVAGNDLLQGNRDFTVTLGTPPAGVTLGIASAGGTIQEDEAIDDIAVIDGKSGLPVAIAPDYYTGPVAGIEREFIQVTPQNLTIAVAGANWFIHSGSGDDAIAVAGGTNVLDGGTGSNFLTGAAGFDTFFVDARGAVDPIWSTVNGFGKGDAATLWGISPDSYTLSWGDDEGAVGFKGLTLHATAPGLPTASLTLPGYSLATKDSALTVLSGFDPGSGSNYMYVLAN